MSIVDETPIYEKIGGEIPLRKLVDDFYDFMDVDQHVQGIRKQHPSHLVDSRNKLFMFLSGWTGGPQLFVNSFGHPRLRARHLPFQIGESERDQWMKCMEHALSQSAFTEDVKTILYKSLYRLADHMRNQNES